MKVEYIKGPWAGRVEEKTEQEAGILKKLGLIKIRRKELKEEIETKELKFDGSKDNISRKRGK
jgi:hypothetical protein